MRILLDTSAYSLWKKGNRSVHELISGSEHVHLSVIVAGELLSGFERGSFLKKNLKELEAFLASPYVSLLPVSYDTARRFAGVYTSLHRKGTPISTNDMWIAAQALESGAEVVSFDDHFRHVEGLSWIKPQG